MMINVYTNLFLLSVLGEEVGEAVREAIGELMDDSTFCHTSDEN